MTPRTRKVLSTLTSASWLWFVASCDPNVVIGTKLAGGSGAEGGSSSETSGSGGMVTLPPAGSAGTAPGGSAGDAAEGGSAGEPPVVIGGAGADGDPPLLFEATHSDGNLAEWDEGPDSDAGGYYADPGVALPKFVMEPAHSPGGAAQITIDTGAGDKIARLYRRVEQADAYYSAWFYLAEDHTPTTWWSIFLFRAVKDRNASIDLWSIDLLRRSDDTLTFGVFDHASSKLIPATVEPIIEVGRWFQVQAFLHQESGKPSTVTFYCDGVEFLTLDDATAAPKDQPLYWVIGNGAAKLAPTVSTLYVDDAAISTAFVAP
jgi:hypothetical protein